MDRSASARRLLDLLLPQWRELLRGWPPMAGAWVLHISTGAGMNAFDTELLRAATEQQ